MASRVPAFECTVTVGFFLWLMMYRLLHWAAPRHREFSLSVIAALWFAAGAFTFFIEAVVFKFVFSAPVVSMLQIDFDFQSGIRPGWYVWGIGVILIAVGAWRAKPWFAKPFRI
jgi:hypothetical protein